MSLGYAAAFLGGVAALLSPCAAMLLPSFFAMAFGARKVTLLGRVGIFYLGTLLTLVPLGLAAGSVGSLLVAHRATIAAVGGIVLIVFGVATMLGASLPVPGLRARGGTSALAVLVLGAVYGLAGACTGPLLGAILTFVAVQGSSIYGAMLLALFGLGMAAPLALLALCWEAGNLAERLRPRRLELGPIRTSVWGIVAGVLFVALGLLFLLSDATGALGGLLDATAQLRLETDLWRIASHIPDWAALAALATVVSLLAVWALRRAERRADRSAATRPPSR